MLRSSYCSLSGFTEKELTDVGECPYDSGGYFVINGSEKVGCRGCRGQGHGVMCCSGVAGAGGMTGLGGVGEMSRG
jgi:hypothetical protein